ncbi:hypothetical protein OWV82_010758 [Melia azedarach]|uniref:Uncharacterized protein n=1 Tax=Melia azedarach TaxID=155640 RepID=A0ACC1Y6P5_MELAZ|nr:hypothetical protein OWV82_010758 [Melia azedarach]
MVSVVRVWSLTLLILVVVSDGQSEEVGWRCTVVEGYGWLSGCSVFFFSLVLLRFGFVTVRYFWFFSESGFLRVFFWDKKKFL